MSSKKEARRKTIHDDSLPAYSVCEDSEGKLVNKRLGVTWPDPPPTRYQRVNGHCSEFGPAETEKSVSKKSRRRKKKDHDKAAKDPTTAASQKLNEEAVNVAKHFAGLRRSASVERELRPGQFKLFYSLPDVAPRKTGREAISLGDPRYQSIPGRVPLLVGYKSSQDKFHTFTTRHDLHGHWVVDTGDRDPPTFVSLAHLIRHYNIHNYVDPSTYELETFPLWDMNEQKGAKSASYTTVYDFSEPPRR